MLRRLATIFCDVPAKPLPRISVGGQGNGADLEPETASTLAIFEEKLIRDGEECLDRVRAMLVEPSVERALSPAPH